MGLTPQETDPTTQEKFLALLGAEPEIIRRLIAERIGVTQAGVMRPESEPESRPESQPESLEAKVIRLLVADGRIEFTLPSKPRSRLQKYRLTDKSPGATANLKSRNVPE